ncbi:ABC transporter ATP-binding protein [Halomarina oriensis]|uniref:ATP-binding cassette domain-containing protein n=1 Tax=Halomarina oriensis TaxID=671145 RepID=A0A6B0GP82_9EURY|nr:ABC transporter ATP-binding protein [Halomarina oriensis]MWG35339.1 ATP-binding cassette domain-containing protein [Halomarina oriensis]
MRDLFVRYARADWPLFVLGVVTSVLGRFVSLAPPLVLGVAIDATFNDDVPYTLPYVPSEWLPTTQTEEVVFSVGLVVAALVGSVLFTWTNGAALSLFSNRVQHYIRVDSYEAMQRLDMAFFDDKQTGQVLAILNDDVRNLRMFLGSTVSSALQLVATVLGIAFILFTLNWQLALVTLVFVPLLAVFTYWFMRTIRPRYRALRASIGDLNTRLENNLDGMEVIKTAHTETHETDRIRETSWEYYLRTWAVAKLEYLYQPSMDLLAGLAFAVTFLLGGLWLVGGAPGPFTGTLLVGEFVTFLFMTQRFVDPLSGVGRIVNSYENARASGERIVGLVSRPVEVRDREDSVVRETVEGHVEYDDVTFSYRSDRPVVRNLSFAADAGDTIAFVGPTGAGKSTAAKLLLRLYEVDSGTIRVDGVDVRALALDSLRSNVGYVSQDVFLFDGSVAENVRYGSFDATDEEVEAAARLAEAHAFVENLPEGYETRVGERGVKLSGGQRQRIAIARAMLQNPAILVLDEATSSVDTETELLIQRGLARLTADRTTLVIAHRLSTVKDADLILVVDDGEVVERGTHDELLDHGGLYATLWNVQAGAEATEEFIAEVVARADRGT